jgi:hypothetical protein
MKAINILNFSEHALLRNASKKELINMVLLLRADLEFVKKESEMKLVALQEQLAAKDTELEKLTKENINKTINQPSSKQPEFNKSTGSDPKKKRKKRRGRAGRKGGG